MRPSRSLSNPSFTTVVVEPSVVPVDRPERTSSNAEAAAAAKLAEEQAAQHKRGVGSRFGIEILVNHLDQFMGTSAGE